MAENKGYQYLLGTRMYTALHLYGRAARHEALYASVDPESPKTTLEAVQSLLRKATHTSENRKQRTMATTALNIARRFRDAASHAKGFGGYNEGHRDYSSAQEMDSMKEKYTALQAEYHSRDNQGNIVTRRRWDSPVPVIPMSR